MNSKRKILVLSATFGFFTASPFVVSGCNQQDQIIRHDTMYYYDYDYDIDTGSKLPIGTYIETYRAKSNDKICYLSLSEFTNLYRIIGSEFYAKKVSYDKGIYVYESFNAKCEINTINDTIRFSDPYQFFNTDRYFGSWNTEVTEQSKITHLGENKKDGYYSPFDLAKYNFDILDLQGKDALIPYEPLSYILASYLNFSRICFNNDCLQLYFGDSWIVPPVLPDYKDEKFLNYNYDCLCFLFDYDYGLKSKRYIKNYDDFFKSATLQIDGKTTTYYDAFHYPENEASLSVTLYSFLQAVCDDGHTAYLEPISTDLYDDIRTARTQYSGERLSHLSYLTTYYSYLFSEDYGRKCLDYTWENFETRPTPNNYYFLTFVERENKTPKAVIKFDQFFDNFNSRLKEAPYDPYIEEYYPYGIDYGDFEDPRVLEFFEDNSTLVQFLWADYKIKEYNKEHSDAPIKDVLIDITNNGGGHVSILLDLLAFISTDGIARMSYYDTVTEDFVECALKVDTNIDGVCDEKDGYGDVYNFYIITSGFSFSCGNAFPSFAKKYYNIPLIGNTTGGGSCVVLGGLFLPYGDFFQISSTENMGILDDGNYFYDIDNGAKEDYYLKPREHFNYEFIADVVDDKDNWDKN